MRQIATADDDRVRHAPDPPDLSAEDGVVSHFLRAPLVGLVRGSIDLDDDHRPGQAKSAIIEPIGICRRNFMPRR